MVVILRLLRDLVVKRRWQNDKGVSGVHTLQKQNNLINATGDLDTPHCYILGI